jgi:hypothetical protein
LLHAHSGVESSHNSLHLPGLEIIDNNLTDSQILEPVSNNEDLGIVVGVCTGINRVINFTETDLELPFLPSKKNIASIFHYSSRHITFYFKSPPANQLAKTNSSRAPPFFTSLVLS